MLWAPRYWKSRQAERRGSGDGLCSLGTLELLWTGAASLLVGAVVSSDVPADV